jgi:hypothetical protein
MKFNWKKLLKVVSPILLSILGSYVSSDEDTETPDSPKEQVRNVLSYLQDDSWFKTTYPMEK